MLSALIFITLLYLAAIGSLIYGFDRVEEFQIGDDRPQHKFSIIIPFRNEENTLPVLLNSISNLKYPLSHSEFIFIDDDSSDGSSQLIEDYFSENKFKFRILENEINSGSPKKDAITIGVNQSTYNWIITTDADCKLPPYWLDAFDSFIKSSNVEMVVAPVMYGANLNFLDRFQTLDMLSLQGATIGGFGIGKPFLCNGANLCYSKNLFEKLKGFEGNTKTASGDDMFLLQKTVKQFPSKVKYLKSEHSIVETSTLHSLRDLLHQRVRWAAKSKSYKSLFSVAMALLVFLMNVSLLAGVIFAFLDIISPKSLLYLFVIKACLDFLLIFKSARFFNKEQLLLSYPSTSLLYPIFVLIVGVMSSFGVYKWKERSYRD